MKRFTAILLMLGLLTGCGAAPVQTEPTTEPTQSTELTTAPTEETTAPTEPADPIAVMMENMTLEEKVGQLFMVRPESLGVTSNPTQVTAQLLAQYPVGGIMVAKQNITDEAQIVAFTKAFQEASAIPMLISVDEEGGIVARFANHSAFDLPKYKSAGAVGASGDAADALQMGRTIGAYLNGYGINMDLAPVADVNTNPNNPVIGTRAFSSDPVIAAAMANAMATGLKENGIAPVFKHFPGHGDTAEDSHSKLAVSYKTMEQLQECEWLPYENLTEADCVMVAHVALPNVTGNMTPATMSAEIIQGILRQQLGFTGVVMTDAMEMGAITNAYGAGEAAVTAIAAGCDIILGPQNFKEAYTALLEAVKNGTITEERLNESVYRILKLKQTYGLL